MNLPCLVRKSSSLTLLSRLVLCALPSSESWMCIEYISDLESLFLASHEGDLLLVNTSNGDISSYGDMRDGGGILALSWSTSNEMLVILTLSNILLTLSQEGDVLNEVPLVNPFSSMYPVGIIWRGDSRYLGLFHFLLLSLSSSIFS